LYLYENKGFFSYKQEETRKERKLMWATAVDDTLKMTHFMPQPFRVSAPMADYVAPAPHSPDTCTVRRTRWEKCSRSMKQAGQSCLKSCRLVP